MKRALIFAKRNLKEIIRDPLSLIFNFAFPIAMLLLFFCFTWGQNSTDIENHTPMFIPYNIVPAIAIFGFSFLTMFGGFLVSKDRTSSLTARLRTSPMKPYEFFLGYALPLFVIAFIQVILIYIFGWLFSYGISDASLRFNPWTLNSLIVILLNIPIAIFFISAGIFFGVLVNDKAIGGLASIIVNLTAIMSGMFMPVATMGGFKIVCEFLPFYHAASLSQDASLGNWPSNVSYYSDMIIKYEEAGMKITMNIGDTWWMHLIVICIYTLLMVIASIFMFRKKMQSDK